MHVRFSRSEPATIESIVVRALDLDLARPVETASGTMKTTPIVLLDIRCSDGVVGSSYVRCYTPIALGALGILMRDIGQLLLGHNAEPQGVEMSLQRHFRLLGPEGLTGIAMAGIDMALWDALAKAAGLPLVRLLGGEPRPIPAYASLRNMDPTRAAWEAEELAQLGFTAIKVKVGRADLAADLEVIRAIRDVVGSTVALMLDYNQSLSVSEAIARGSVLDGENIYWIEEPTAAQDFAGHAEISAALATPIQLGENWWGVNDALKSISAKASDHVMFDVMKLGGVSGWMRAAALSQEHGLPTSSHTFPEFSAHLLGVTPTCHWLEYLDHVGPILQEPVRFHDGHILPSQEPGAGIAWDESAISRLGNAQNFSAKSR